MTDSCAPYRGSCGTYDLAVIGAGSAGFSAAITAAEQDARVALIARFAQRGQPLDPCGAGACTRRHS